MDELESYQSFPVGKEVVTYVFRDNSVQEYPLLQFTCPGKCDLINENGEIQEYESAVDEWKSFGGYIVPKRDHGLRPTKKMKFKSFVPTEL